MKAILAIVSDLHINSTVALATPTVNLDDGGTYHANRTQHWLWECWNDLWKRLSEYDDTWRRILVINGDMGELDTKRRSVQLISPNKATILRLVTDTVEPAVNWAEQVYVMRGTAAHTGKSAWLEEAIASDLSHAVKYSDGIASWWHLRATLNSVRLDIAHHASMGSLPWTRQNACVRLASKTLWQYRIQRNQPAPQLMIRSHNHVSEEATVEGVHVWFTPAWSTLTEHGYRNGFENELSHIGGVVAECDNGQERSYKIAYEPKGEKRVWTLQM